MTDEVTVARITKARRSAQVAMDDYANHRARWWAWSFEDWPEKDRLWHVAENAKAEFLLALDAYTEILREAAGRT